MKKYDRITTPRTRNAVWPTLLLAAFTLLSVPVTSVAGQRVSFKAAFVTAFNAIPVPDTPFMHISVVGAGNSSHMGTTTAATDNQMVNLLTGASTATYTLIGANGDSLVVEMEFQTTFLSPTEVSFQGSYTVKSGTGRFAGVVGSGALEGSASTLSQTGGAGDFSLIGTISRYNRD